MPEENWQTVLSVLRTRTAGMTHKEIWEVWPTEAERPGVVTLSEWRNRACETKRVRREGKGTRTQPWRYRLPNADDEYYDRGELPPLGPLFG